MPVHPRRSAPHDDARRARRQAPDDARPGVGSIAEDWRGSWRRVGMLRVPLLAEIPRVGFGHRLERPPTSRQLNLRLDTRDYESLAIAARILGTKPTQVARMLVNAGVRRLLAEYDVTMDRVPSQS